MLRIGFQLKISVPSRVPRILETEIVRPGTAPTATISDIAPGNMYSLRLEYKERFLGQVRAT
jgi:hypothetical protein